MCLSVSGRGREMETTVRGKRGKGELLYSGGLQLRPEELLVAQTCCVTAGLDRKPAHTVVLQDLYRRTLLCNDVMFTYVMFVGLQGSLQRD